MGDLLFFDPPRTAHARRARKRERKKRASCSFTGVRYGRQPQPVPARVDQDAPPKGGVDGTGGGRRKRRG